MSEAAAAKVDAKEGEEGEEGQEGKEGKQEDDLFIQRGEGY